MESVNILFQMHVSETMSSSPPFTHIIPNEVNILQLDMDKINKIVGDKEECEKNMETFSQECYTAFKERYPRCLRGSVDVQPSIWTFIAMKSIVVAFNEGKLNKRIELPNGCCNMSHCSINLFYEILIERLLTSHRIINNDESINAMYGVMDDNSSEEKDIVKDNSQTENT